MSLSVNVFTGTPDNMHMVEVEHHEMLAGFERCRSQLYGAAIAKALGCVLLPKLKEMDIYAVGPELGVLKNDVQLLLDNISKVESEPPYDQEFIKNRCGNISRAIDRAIELSGGVVIW
jgi:hypothetical protein